MKAWFKRSGTVNIDGRNFSGRSIVINGDQVIVDGVVQSGNLVGPVKVTIHGDVDRIETVGGDVSVTGSVGGITTTSGDVKCGDVQGSVKTVSGDVESRSIAGSVQTVSGDISHR